MVAIGVGNQEAAPRGEPIDADLSVLHCALEPLEYLAQTSLERAGPECPQVKLGLLYEIDVEGAEAEVSPASIDLVEQEAGREAVAAHDGLWIEDPGLDVGVVHLALRVLSRQGFGVESQLAALRDDDDLVAFDLPFSDRALQFLADRALAREVAIRECGVEDVDSALEAPGDGGSVQQIFDASRSTTPRSESEGREGQRVGPAEVSRKIREALGETPGSCWCGPPGESFRDRLL